MTRKKTKTKNKSSIAMQQKVALMVVIIALFLLVNAFGGFIFKSFKKVRKNRVVEQPVVTQPIKQALEVCDHNYDGKVDLIDLGLFSACQNTFDANGDDVHDLKDVGLYASNYHDTSWCRTMVPECGNQNIIETTNFGLTINLRTNEELRYSMSIMDDLGVNRTRFFEDWSNREPSLGQEKWSGLDMRINGLNSDNKSLVLTIKPIGIKNDVINWYCQEDQANINSCVFKPEYEDDFRIYIEKIIKRYPGKIDKIQFSNEWDSTYHFVGTAQDYVKYANILYSTIKKNSPDTTVSLGSITKWPLIYIAGCQLDLIDEFYTPEGVLMSPTEKEAWCNAPERAEKNQRVEYVFANAKYDMVDVHLYDDPENWTQYMQALQTLIDKKDTPIISTEFGGPREQDLRFGDPYDEGIQADRLQLYLDKLVELPISEAYYFRMIEGEGPGIGHPLTGLMKMEGDPYPAQKLNYPAFKNFISQQ
jgi:hypothetical protein